MEFISIDFHFIHWEKKEPQKLEWYALVSVSDNYKQCVKPGEFRPPASAFAW